MNSTPGGATLLHPIRPDDIDALGIVYHANYLRMVDHCIVDWWNDAGWDMQSEVAPVVRAITIEYLAPIRRMGTVEVFFAITSTGTTSVTYSFEIRSGGTIHARGTRVNVFVYAATGRPTPIPADLWERAAPLLALPAE